jgi:site-specific DNA-cytosine methylase
MGYPKNFIIRDIGVSETQLYRQFGNSVVAPVVAAVAKKMISFIEKNINGKNQYPIIKSRGRSKSFV